MHFYAQLYGGGTEKHILYSDIIILYGVLDNAEGKVEVCKKTPFAESGSKKVARNYMGVDYDI